MSEAALELRGVSKAYRRTGAPPLEVLRGVDLTLRRGELVALVAPSGAGKSTLLHVAGLLDTADAGEVRLSGRPMTGPSEAMRTRARLGEVGFVYQFHHLLPEFTALENVILPQSIAGTGGGAARERARALLARVGLAERAAHRPAALSGGEQQRVAIARALANAPSVLLADEPTGNLDPATSARVFDMLLSVARDQGMAALVATHNPDLAARMDRTMVLDGGRLRPA